MKLSVLGRRAQTSVEYVLILLVAVTLAVTVLKNLRNVIFANIANCNSPQDSVGCMIVSQFNFSGREAITFFNVRR